MNPKIQKLKAEREKNTEKIAALQQRNKEIDSSVLELENLDIIGMVRSCGLTPEALAKLMQAVKNHPLPVPSGMTEEMEAESYAHEE